MTEPTDDPTPATEPDAEDIGDESTLDPKMRDAFKKLRSENRRLRTRLRDSEEQVGIASARLSAHHRAVVAAAAKAAGMIDGEDLLSVYDPNEFLDEQFADVVDDKVVEATRALLDAKPYLGRPVGPPPTDRPVEGLRSGARPADKPKSASWATAIRGSGA
jgi:hypothetical protein